MLPYCYGELSKQQAEIATLGEERWLAKNLPVHRPAELPAHHPLPQVASAQG
jgi:hypothetical protein